MGSEASEEVGVAVGEDEVACCGAKVKRRKQHKRVVKKKCDDMAAKI